MLQSFPDAFTSSYEEDVRKPLSWVRARLEGADGNASHFVLGAFDENRTLVGSVGLSVEGRQKQHHKAHLFGMFVATEAMGKGVGRALLAACIARARTLPGLEQINLTVTATNARVKRLYEAAGFRAFGIEERAVRIDGVYLPKAHMALRLACVPSADGSLGRAAAAETAASDSRFRPSAGAPSTSVALESFSLDGGCDCASVRYRMTSAPLFVHCCHCRWCQRESGASFALNALIEADRVQLLQGAVELVDTPSNSGKGQWIARCPRCRIAVWSNYAGAGEGVRFVRVGTLDEPGRLPPDIHIFTASKQPWIVLPPGIPAVEAYYQRSRYWPKASLARRAALLAGGPGG